MKPRSLIARNALGLFVTLLSVLSLSGCHTPLYYYQPNQFAGRAVPPSGFLQRVMATYNDGSIGGAAIIDGYRDLRSNVQNTVQSHSISGYSGNTPSQIINYPEQQMGYIVDTQGGTVTPVDYATEKTGNAILRNLGADVPAAMVAPDGTRAVAASVLAPTATTGTGTGTGSTESNAGQIVVYATGSQGGTYTLNLPNVNRVVMNPGNSVILAMTRNSNSLYRIIQLPQSSNPVFPPGYVDCQPLLLPVYCIVPVKGNFDRPTNAYFSLDGASTYVENCGPECGGSTASLAVLQTSALIYNNIPTADPLAAGSPPALATLPVANPVPIPGGITDVISDGTNLYIAGQSLFRLNSDGTLGNTRAADGLFAGFLTVMPLSSYTPRNPVSISDGTHTRLLFADDDTLWVGSRNCAVGERAHAGQNINCLTMVKLGDTPSATIIPKVTPGGSSTVPYPNTNGNLYYYGDLTGECWVQNFHKVYTAYGGQVHAFNTSDGSEINNANITVQGTVLDVAYLDALTNQAN